MTMTGEGGKLDLTKTDRPYYAAPRHPQLVTISELSYLAVTDRGAPDSPVFAAAVEALYKLAYGVKARHKAVGRDFAVPKLEGLWWAEAGREALEAPRETWQWKLLIRMPEFVDAGSVNAARETAMAKNKQLDAIRRIRLERLAEGMAVQMLHVGPYSTEPETLRAIHAFMAAQRLEQRGLHHEIYLSDPRKTAPSAMKTILRLPVRSVAAPRMPIIGTEEPV